MGIKEDIEKLTPMNCLVAGFILSVLYYFLLFDNGSGIDAQVGGIEQEIVKANERLKGVNDALENKSNFEARAVAIGKELEELLKFFPANANINDFQKEVTSLLKQTNNQLFKIQAEEVQARFPGYTETGVRIEMQGGYNEIMDFLSLMTQMKRMIDYKIMAFDGAGSTDEISQVKLTILLTVFGAGAAG